MEFEDFMKRNKAFVWTMFGIIIISLLMNSFSVTGQQTLSIARFRAVAIPYPDMGYWKFNEGYGTITQDKTFNNNDGNLINGASWSTNSVSGFAVELDGLDDGVQVTTSSSLNPKGSFSIDAWIYPRSFSQNQIIVAKWGDEGSWNNQRAYSFHTLTNGGLRFAISDTEHQLDGSFHIFDTPTGVLTLNEWNHVTATYNSKTGTRKIYVGGVEVASRTDAPIKILGSVTDLGIGIGLTSPTTEELHFDGYIDEVKLYSKAIKPN